MDEKQQDGSHGSPSNLRSDIQSLHHASFKRTELKDPAHIQGEEIA